MDMLLYFFKSEREIEKKYAEQKVKDLKQEQLCTFLEFDRKKIGNF